MANTPAPEVPAKVAAVPAPEVPAKAEVVPAPAGPGKLTLSNPGAKTAVKRLSRPATNPKRRCPSARPARCTSSITRTITSTRET